MKTIPSKDQFIPPGKCNSSANGPRTNPYVNGPNVPNLNTVNYKV